jgi:hypothetical protein
MRLASGFPCALSKSEAQDGTKTSGTASAAGRFRLFERFAWAQQRSVLRRRWCVADYASLIRPAVTQKLPKIAAKTKIHQQLADDQFPAKNGPEPAARRAH